MRSEILDSKGHLLAYYYPRGIDREPVSFNQISPIMRKAIVAIEDSRFYQHGAIDFRGTLRALVNDVAAQAGPGRVHAHPAVREERAHPDRAERRRWPQQASSPTLSRKIKELRLAIQVENQMTKDQILAGYLNAAFFGTFYGNQAVGVGAAAERYFGTTAAKLTLTQSALLAGMVENPVALQPSRSPGRGAQAAQRGAGPDGPAARHHPGPGGGGGTPAARAEPHHALQTGCTSASAKSAAFFCDYVVSLMKQNHAFSTAWNDAEQHRRAEDLHHAEPPGPARRQAGGELHGPAAAERGSTQAATPPPRY